jgi:predicted esterase
MFPVAESLTDSMGIASINGLELENGQRRWFRRFEEGVFDLPNLVERSDELAEALIAAYPDRQRIAFGYSNGANMAASIILRRPEVFDAAVLFAAMFPIEPDVPPNLTGKRFLMVQGEQDRMAPPPSASRLADLLETSGAEVEVLWHPGGHSIPEEAFALARTWLANLPR